MVRGYGWAILSLKDSNDTKNRPKITFLSANIWKFLPTFTVDLYVWYLDVRYHKKHILSWESRCNLTFVNSTCFFSPHMPQLQLSVNFPQLFFQPQKKWGKLLQMTNPWNEKKCFRHTFRKTKQYFHIMSRTHSSGGLKVDL